MTDWFRSWHGAPTDPKWLGIARKASVAPGIAVAIAWALMDRASQADERGCISGYDADGLACFFGCEPEQVDAIVAAMEEKGVLHGGRFTSWEKRQPKREDSSTQRVQAHRERTKSHVKRDETHCNAPDTDTDTEKNISNASALDVQQPQDDLALTEAVAVFNSTAADVGWSKVQSLNPTRRTSLKARLRECGGIAGWRAAMARARASPFLTGEGGREWRADFDFFLKASKFTKLMEGAYDRPGRPIAGIEARPDPRPSGTQRALAGLAKAASERPDSRLFALDTGGAGFGRGPTGDGGGNGGSSGCPPLRLIDG